MDNLGYKEEGEGGGGVNDDDDGNAFYKMSKSKFCNLIIHSSKLFSKSKKVVWSFYNHQNSI